MGDALQIVMFAIMMMISFTDAARKDTFYAGGYEFTYFADGDDNIPFCEAMSACLTLGESARLAVLKEKYLEDAVRELLSYWGEVYPWIGGTDNYSEGFWTWVDGTPLRNGYTNWGEPQPDNYDDMEHCLHLSQDLTWNDINCDSRLGYVCQKDTSKSLASDYAELSQDSSYNMSKNKNAGDGDLKVNYWNALNECGNHGTRLVESDGEKTYQNLMRRLKKDGLDKYWIGGILIEGTWKWNNGEKIKFFKWASGQPSGEISNKCLAMTHNGWEDHDCDETLLHFVCESVRPHLLKISDERPIVQESKNLEIDCTANGFPIPDVAWYKDDELVTDKTDQRIHQSIGSATSTLVINNVQLVDAPKYYCLASNIIKGQKVSIRGATEMKIVPRDVDPESVHDWKIQNEDLEEYDLPEPCETSQSNWMIPVIISLVIIVVLQFALLVVGMCKRSTFSKKPSDATLKPPQYTVYNVGSEKI